MRRTALNRHKTNQGLKGLTRTLKMFTRVWSSSKVLETVLRYNNYWEIRFKQTDTPAKMLEKIEDQFDKLTKLLNFHTYISRASVLYQAIAMIVMTENGKGIF